jgi:hypothetical protein
MLKEVARRQWADDDEDEDREVTPFSNFTVESPQFDDPLN